MSIWPRQSITEALIAKIGQVNKIEDFAKSNKTQLIYIDDYPNNTNFKIDDTLRQKIIKLNYRLELFDNYLVINKAKDED